MAAYDGVPSIRLEGDRSRALALVPDAKALLYRVQQFLKISETTTFSASQSVGRDGYIYVLSSGGQNIIHIAVDVVGVDQVEPEIPAPEEGRPFPSFYSGLVFNGYLEQRTGATGTYSVCTGFTPTPTCLHIHDELSAGRQATGRLAVQPFFEDLQNQGAGPAYSQYTKLRASMYSGTMATVVQVVMGLGRINKSALRDPLNPNANRGYIQAVDASGVQVRYDYKFHRTHGITYSSDGYPWLIEISQARGVLAMPLPMFPRSTTSGFLARAVARGDTTMETALTDIGGLPTGEVFPTSTDALDARIADGTVLQLLSAADLEPFYANQPYSVNMGWAFNSRGSEAHNTGYRFEIDNVQRGVWYLINLSIGPMDEDRAPGAPLAVASASLRRQSEGYLFASRTPLGKYLPIKFYDPLLKGLRSHDGAPSLSTTMDPRCDTVMFVCFVNDELKTVRFFRNPNSEMINETDDPRYPGECMYAGSWTITQTVGLRGFPTMMYTNDFDDRQVLDPYVQVTQIDSRDLGFNPPRFTDIITALDWAYVTRHKVFKRTTVVDTREGAYAGAVVVIPQFCRETYYYATGSAYTVGRSGSTSVAYDSLKDPNVGWSWRNFPSAAGSNPSGLIECQFDNCGGRRFRGPHPQRKIVCTPKEAGGDCSDYADSGTWLMQCESVDSFNSVPAPNRVPRSTVWNLGADERASLQIVTRGHNGPISLPLEYSQFANEWTVPSPDPETFIIQQLVAEYSTLGDDCVVFTTDLSGGEVVQRGYAAESVGQSFPCFIGVNQP